MITNLKMEKHTTPGVLPTVEELLRVPDICFDSTEMTVDELIQNLNQLYLK